MAAIKGFRMNEELRARFEAACRENLYDERSVVEAWLLRFLDASQDERQRTAKRYSEWVGERKAAPAKPRSVKGK
ncbi:MAG: hypothetical protein K8T91_14615 [Planctomycetes bacterium]|nr:hypothetical protein [Planctomycetota bacterium]